MEQEGTNPEAECILIGTTPTCPGARPVSTTRQSLLQQCLWKIKGMLR